MQRYLVLFLTFSLLVQMILPLAAFAQTTEIFARVTANSLNVRSGPGTSFEAIDKVTRGVELYTIRQESGWVQVELPSGTTGWVSARHVEFIEVIVTTPGDPPEPKATPPSIQPRVDTSNSNQGSGGSSLGTIFKWTTLLGAAAVGGLAYNERTQGNDSYDEYEQFALNGDDAEAALKWDEAADHDDKAQLYGIVAGGLFGVFILQQFVFGRGGSSYDVTGPRPLPLSWNPETNEFRASLTLARF